MKIDNQLVQLVNARLQDLKFEIDTIGYLLNIEEDKELFEDFAKIDIGKSLEENFPQTTIEVEVEFENEDGDIESGMEFQLEDIPYESRTMYAIKTIMKDMKVSDSNGILNMISERSNIEIADLEDAVKLYENVENDIKHVLQTDMVKNFLSGKGLDEQSQINIDFVKDDVLYSVMRVLGIKSEELK